MKKNFLAGLIFLATLAVLTIPMLMLTLGAETDSFTVATTVTNTGPAISTVTAVSDSPNAGTTKSITFSFNVTDNNTVTDMDLSSVFMNITQGGTTRTSSSCSSASNSSDDLTQNFTCTIDIYYYDTDGAWDICAYVADQSAVGVSDCTTADLTMGITHDLTVPNASISFSGNAGQQDVSGGNVLVNNTGNQDYAAIRINATYLESGSTYIGATNFSVNATADAATGQALTENTFLSITSSVVNNSASATKDLYFYLDIPNALEDDTYNSARAWVIDATTS